MGNVVYRYLGEKTHVVDNQSGSGQVWRGQGDEQAIPERCEARFVEVYGDYFELVRREGEPEEPGEPVPAGTPYSTLSPEQIRALYQERTGKRAHPRTGLAKLLAEIQQADALAENQAGQQEQAESQSQAAQADLLGGSPP